MKWLTGFRRRASPYGWKRKYAPTTIKNLFCRWKCLYKRNETFPSMTVIIIRIKIFRTKNGNHLCRECWDGTARECVRENGSNASRSEIKAVRRCNFVPRVAAIRLVILRVSILCTRLVHSSNKPISSFSLNASISPRNGIKDLAASI